MNLSSPLNSIIGQTPDSGRSSLIFAILFHSSSRTALGLWGFFGAVVDGDGGGDGGGERDRKFVK